jgi:structural maintenance of chromosome 1
VDALKQLKAKQLQQLQELSQSKPKEKDDEGKYQTLTRLQAELGTANDDLAATRLRLEGLRKELAAVEKDLAKMKPEREKRAKALRDAENKLKGLAQTVEAADDGVFATFCQRINVDNIREYEDVQLKVAREENEALEEFKTKSARNTHAVEFEEQQLQATEDRLASLQATLEREERNREARNKRKQKVEEEIAALQAEIERQEAKLEKAKQAAESVGEDVENARNGVKRAQRELDNALKEIASWNDEIERSASDRHAIYRRCRLEDIDLPLNRGNLNKVPIDDNTAEMAMDVDGGSMQPARTDDYGIEPDFDPLTDEDRENDTPEYGTDFETQIAKMKADLERVVPNMKAVDRLKDVQNDLQLAEDEADDARRASKEARDKFLSLKKKRCELFNKAYQHMSGCIDRIYKDLTKQANGQGGGMAFLSLEDSEEPYLAGVKYNTMPPGKRFVEIEQLSGGEKTMAALALLFSIHR